MAPSKKRAFLEAVLAAGVVLFVTGGVPAVVISRQRACALQETSGVKVPPLTEQQEIKPEDLMENLQFLANEKMEGRDTHDAGCVLPSLFLRRELRRLGYLPKGDLTGAEATNEGVAEHFSYFQTFEAKDTVFKNGTVSTVRLPTRNVIGYIEGEKADEWVILGAHYDHVGRGSWGSRENPPTGKVHCGADDNGSGTVATLAVAEVFSKLAANRHFKPKRNVMVCFWGAEEMGELGSVYFTENLPKGMDKEKIAAYINMDMVGRNAAATLSLLCAPPPYPQRGEQPATEAKAEMCKELYALTEAVNKDMETGFTIKHRDTEDEFERSDQWSFYRVPLNNRRRIACFFLTTGDHDDYHTSTDTWDKIEYPKLARVAKLAFGIAWRVSQMDGVPLYK